MLSRVAISNKKSGMNRLDWKRYREHRRINKTREIVEKDGYGKLYLTGESDNYVEELDQIMIEACKFRPDVFIFAGGDWSFLMGVTMLRRHWPEKELPLIAPTCEGSFVMMAKRVGVKNTFSYLENIMNTKDVDDLKVKGIELMEVKDDMGKEHLSFSTGIGVPNDILDEIYKKKEHKYGRVVSMCVKLFGSTMLGLGNYHQKFENKTRLRVTTKGPRNRWLRDKVTMEEDWLGVMAQTLDLSYCMPWPLSKWINLFRNAENPSKFQIVGTTSNFERVFRYSLIKELDAIMDLNKQPTEAVITSDDKPFKYTSGGEQSFGPDPFLARGLYIKSGVTANLVMNDF